MKQRIGSAALAAALLLSLSACGGATVASAEANQTYTGTVSAISASAVTVSTEDKGEVQISLSDDTVFQRENSGMDGAAPSDAGGDAPDAPTQEGEGSAPEPPSDSEGTAPDASATPPEKPESEGADAADATTQSGGDSDAPEPPDGEGGGAPVEAQETLTYESVQTGDTVTVETGSDAVATTVTLADTSSSGGIDYSAANEYTEDTTVSGETLASTGTDENAVLVATDGVTATLDGVTITRESADSAGGDNSSFYGVGAAALVTNGKLVISDSSVSTDAAGGAGVFAYGDGTAYVSDSTITTKQDTSGGIHVAGGGTLYAWDLDVETDGESSAAIRSDRGGGTMVVDGGSYTSNGTGSPAVYSTADITVHDATLTATGSEAICIEGRNTIRLFDCDLTGNMSDLSQNDCTWNVILYQSMSGDSEVGNSTFEMVGGSLTAKNGGMFYTTNTESTFYLSGVDITNAADSEFFLKCTGNSNQRGWGSAGANGADCSFTAEDQTMEGDVIWDSISQLDFYMLGGSTLTGAVVQDESNAGDGGSGYANVYIDADSTWVVTGDSTVSALFCAGTIVDADGNTVSVVGSDGTVYVSGTSAYTVTVGSYSSAVDTSGATTADSWSSYEVSRG